MTQRNEQPNPGCSHFVRSKGYKDEPIITAPVQYGLESAAWTLIRHNENMTVNVEDRYLLRVHLHADGLIRTCCMKGLTAPPSAGRSWPFWRISRARGCLCKRLSLIYMGTA